MRLEKLNLATLEEGRLFYLVTKESGVKTLVENVMRYSVCVSGLREIPEDLQADDPYSTWYRGDRLYNASNIMPDGPETLGVLSLEGSAPSIAMAPLSFGKF